MLFQGQSQKAIGLLSRYTTRLMSRPSSCRSLTYSSILDYYSTMRSQLYWQRMCFIFLVGSISPITSSTQLLTPVAKMTGSHSSLRQDRKLSRFLRLQMLSNTSNSSNQRWKSCFLLGDIMQPSSSGTKVNASTSSSSITTVSLLESSEGGRILGLFLLAQMMACGRQALFLGLTLRGVTVLLASGFLVKMGCVSVRSSPFLIMRDKDNLNQFQWIIQGDTNVVFSMHWPYHGPLDEKSCLLTEGANRCQLPILAVRMPRGVDWWPTHHNFKFMGRYDAQNDRSVPGSMGDNCKLPFTRMLAGLELSPQEPAPFVPPFVKTYQSVQQQLDVHQYFSVLHKQEPIKVAKEKDISPKMRAKLLGWLQKLAVETFHFSRQTLITAAAIVDQYLGKTNEQPNVLQLIGCCCLFIASKLREEIIVEPECYAKASCNMFSKRQLIEKERAVYLSINWRSIKEGRLSGLRQGVLIFNMRDKMEQSEELLWQCLKDEELSVWKDVKIIYGILSLLVLPEEEQTSVRDQINLIRLVN